ncbi:MAG: hypothetical protein ACRDZX_06860, partial [Acidimicrobiales bacterium]
VLDVSRATRAWLASDLAAAGKRRERDATQRAARREVAKEEALNAKRTARIADWVESFIRAHGAARPGAIRKKIAYRDRDAVDVALAILAQSGRLVAENDTYRLP